MYLASYRAHPTSLANCPRNNTFIMSRGKSIAERLVKRKRKQRARQEAKSKAAHKKIAEDLLAPSLNLANIIRPYEKRPNRCIAGAYKDMKKKKKSRRERKRERKEKSTKALTIDSNGKATINYRLSSNGKVNKRLRRRV